MLDKFLNRTWLHEHYYFIPQIVSLLIVGPLAYLYFDRTPPQVRLHGTITSAIDQSRPPRVGESFVVHWVSTPHVRDCSGLAQIEITQGDRIWPVLAERPAFNPSFDVQAFTPKPWPLPGDIKPGEAVYRVSTFWDCNWLQRMLPGYSVEEIGPDVTFNILPDK